MAGIDSEITQRMDAYRGNPQALQQRYAQQQQLIDLLALQKLKSEKEEAARQMQMQMPPMPTVAQQREQEVAALTQQEVANDLGMSMPPRPPGQPQGGPQPGPQASGIAGLPSPPMGMKSGGIVSGYAEGGQVDRPSFYDELLRSWREGRIGRTMSAAPDKVREAYNESGFPAAAYETGKQTLSTLGSIPLMALEGYAGLTNELVSEPVDEIINYELGNEGDDKVELLTKDVRELFGETGTEDEIVPQEQKLEPPVEKEAPTEKSEDDDGINWDALWKFGQGFATSGNANLGASAVSGIQNVERDQAMKSALGLENLKLQLERQDKERSFQGKEQDRLLEAMGMMRAMEAEFMNAAATDPAVREALDQAGDDPAKIEQVKQLWLQSQPQYQVLNAMIQKARWSGARGRVKPAE